MTVFDSCHLLFISRNTAVYSIVALLTIVMLFMPWLRLHGYLTVILRTRVVYELIADEAR